eukprot:5083172-Alexandrium_andersonii.AAC.1
MEGPRANYFSIRATEGRVFSKKDACEINTHDATGFRTEDSRNHDVDDSVLAGHMEFCPARG